MDYLDNPGKKHKRPAHKRRASSGRRKAKRKPPHGFGSWGAYMASIRPTTGGTVAKRKKGKGRGARSRAPRAAGARKRRRYHRNPGASSMRGLIGFAKDASVLAGGVTLGKVAARQIPTLLKLNLSDAEAIGAQVAAGGVAGYLLGRFVNRNFGVAVFAGAIAAAVEGKIKAANIPFISPALGDYMGGYVPAGMHGYPALPRPAAPMAGSRGSFSDYQEVEH